MTKYATVGVLVGGRRGAVHTLGLHKRFDVG